MGKFVYFTSAEKRQANEVDLPSFLRDRGEKLLQAGREYRLASDHSITVRGNRWYDHAARRGGHAISFVQRFYDKTFPEAVSMLLGRDGQGIIPIAKQEPEPQEPGTHQEQPEQTPGERTRQARVLPEPGAL